MEDIKVDLIQFSTVNSVTVGLAQVQSPGEHLGKVYLMPGVQGMSFTVSDMESKQNPEWQAARAGRGPSWGWHS